MKYAIVVSGGKQYKAVPGATLEVDRLHLDVGTEVELDDVLLISDGKEVKVGKPTIEGAKVKTTVVSQFKAPKIVIFKYKPQIRYRVKSGHRQQYTRLQVNEISTK